MTLWSTPNRNGRLYAGFTLVPVPAVVTESLHYFQCWALMFASAFYFQWRPKRPPLFVERTSVTRGDEVRTTAASGPSLKTPLNLYMATSLVGLGSVLRLKIPSCRGARAPLGNRRGGGSGGAGVPDHKVFHVFFFFSVYNQSCGCNFPVGPTGAVA